MNDLDLSALLAIGLGLLIRFGIPILLTGLAAWGLRRLDQRWQLQSEHIPPAPLRGGAAPPGSPLRGTDRLPRGQAPGLPRPCSAERPVLAGIPRAGWRPVHRLPRMRSL